MNMHKPIASPSIRKCLAIRDKMSEMKKSMNIPKQIFDVPCGSWKNVKRDIQNAKKDL